MYLGGYSHASCKKGGKSGGKEKKVCHLGKEKKIPEPDINRRRKEDETQKSPCLAEVGCAEQENICTQPFVKRERGESTDSV